MDTDSIESIRQFVTPEAEFGAGEWTKQRGGGQPPHPQSIIVSQRGRLTYAIFLSSTKSNAVVVYILTGGRALAAAT